MSYFLVFYVYFPDLFSYSIFWHTALKVGLFDMDYTLQHHIYVTKSYIILIVLKYFYSSQVLLMQYFFLKLTLFTVWY